jgi:hypothetical protein
VPEWDQLPIFFYKNLLFCSGSVGKSELCVKKKWPQDVGVPTDISGGKIRGLSRMSVQRGAGYCFQGFGNTEQTFLRAIRQTCP